MAQRAEVTKKKALSAVYVNRFGKHSSGAVLRFGAQGDEEEEKNPLVSETPSAGSGSETEREEGAEPCRRQKQLKIGNHPKKSTFISPILRDQKFPLAEVDTRKLLRNNENADVFKFPLPVEKFSERQKKSMPAKKHEVFRVISKMLNENEKLRRRFPRRGHKNTKVTEEEEISENKIESTGMFDATLFGWV